MGIPAMELAKLDMLAMLGMAEMEDMEDIEDILGIEGIDMDRLGTEVGADGEDTFDLFMHFSMCPFNTSLLLNFLPQSWHG